MTTIPAPETAEARALLLHQLEQEQVIVAANALLARYRAEPLRIRSEGLAAFMRRQGTRREWEQRARRYRVRGPVPLRYCACGESWTVTRGRLCPGCGRHGEAA